MAEQKPARTWKKRLLLLMAVSTAALLALELGLRGWLSLRGASYDSGATALEVRRLESSLTQSIPHPEIQAAPGGDAQLDGREVVHPYLGFGNLLTLRTIDREIAYFESPRSEEIYDILIVGGSVAARFHDLGSERLEQLLHEDPRFRDRELRFLRHGRGSYKQPQQLFLVAYLLNLGYQPDAVINVDGFNEVAIGLENGRHGTNPVYPALTKWGHLAGGSTNWEELDLLLELRAAQKRTESIADRVTGLGLHHSAVLGELSLGVLRRLQRRNARAYERYKQELTARTEDPALRGPGHDADTASILKTAIESWSESSRMLQAICDQAGISYLHVLQPTLHDEGSKPLTETEVRSGEAIEEWVTGARRGYPKLRSVGKRLRAQGIRFFDASFVFSEVREDLYFDPCHFNEAGHAILAEAISGAFLSSLGQ